MTTTVTPFDVVKARLQAQSKSKPDVKGRLNGMTVIKADFSVLSLF